MYVVFFAELETDKNKNMTPIAISDLVKEIEPFIHLNTGGRRLSGCNELLDNDLIRVM